VNETAPDWQFMQRAIELAAGSGGDVAPIGCVIARDGLIIGEGTNEVAPRSDPTAHAEIVAIRRACARVGTDLRGATLYSTLQPCGMCTMASIWAHISRIVFSAERHQVHPMYFEDRHLDTMDSIRDAFRDDLRLEGGLLADQSVRLYHRPGETVSDDEQQNI